MMKSTNGEIEKTFGLFRVTVDCVVFGLDIASSSLKLVLVKRLEEPFQDCWSLPGGFVGAGERAEAAARRKLAEKTGLENVFLEQLYTFDDPRRDPRAGNDEIDSIITIAFFALVSPAQHQTDFAGGGNVSEAQWFAVDELDKLGCLSFDHADIIETALTRLRGKLSYVPIGFELLEKKFTLKQLQSVYEIVLGHKLDASNFRRRALQMGILQPLDEMQTNVSHRPAQLYSFDEESYRRLVHDGFDFQL